MFKERLFSMQRSSTKRKSFWISFLVVFLLLFFTLSVGIISPTFAQSSNDNLNTFATASGLPQVDLVTFIGRLVQIFLSIIGIVLVLLIMYGGFIWMTSEGDPGKVDKAKRIIINAIIGLIIIMASFAIATFVMSWLSGSGNGNQNQKTPCIGCDNDWYRSNIGRGPIESVYPAPNQKDVSIDTVIVVTFKEPVTSSTIYGANGFINANTIQICQASSTGACIAGSGFDAGDFVSTTVSSTPDNKTYVFTPNKNLGPADGQNRYFKVTLGNGITKLGKTDSIFGVGGQYAWSFQTNGKMDLNPPYVIASSIYPYADDVKDTYDNVSTPSTGVVTSTFSAVTANVPVGIMGKDATVHLYLDSSLIVEIGTNASGGFKAYVRSPSGFGVATTTPTEGVLIQFTVSSDGTYITFDDNNPALYLGVVYKTDGVCAGKSRCLPLDAVNKNSVDLSGLIMESRISEDPSSLLGPPFPQGSRGSFRVFPATLGDRFIIQNGNNAYKFMFVDEEETRSTITIPKTESGVPAGNDTYNVVKVSSTTLALSIDNLAKAINDSPAGSLVTAEANPTNVVVRAKQSGSGGNSIQIIRWSGEVATSEFLSGGQNISYGRHTDSTTVDPQDSANNSKFQITFNKPINPLSVNGNVIVKSFSNGAWSTVNASTTFTNQYQTVVLTGTIPCGVNSCGQQIYCWTTTTPGMIPTSTPFEVEIKAATLRTCTSVNESWCGSGSAETEDSFGGTCASSARCQKTVGMQTVYYPKTSDLTSGIADLSNNSLNGNYNYYAISGGNLGLSEGKSITTSDGSGTTTPFPLPANTSLWSNRSTGPWSGSAIASTAGGDNFKWSFFLSSLIDLESPLINKIEPYGDQVYGTGEDQTAMDPVKISFDRIMAIDTFKPGWGYDKTQNTATWTQRFLVLQTITSGANPVGYWVGSANVDSDNDGWANYTQAIIRHNNFDQSVQYGPLVGSGLQSITQNCFLPGNGPKFANDASFAATMLSTSSNDCNYKGNGTTDTEGCASDSSIPLEHRVSSTNPASYAHMNCTSVEGAKVCGTDKDCKVLYYTKGVTSTDKFGSWIITKDHATSTAGKTGCCFGVCVDSNGNIVNN
ncbi:MAG: Ig-like domain-containing protein [Patescibacteria group bacterium]|jgi:hypothetical protein